VPVGEAHDAAFKGNLATSLRTPTFNAHLAASAIARAARRAAQGFGEED
jgi:hypothetical protein